MDRSDQTEIAADAFVAGYGRTWEAWDVEGFVDLFTADVVYVVRPGEILVGREALRIYVRKEEREQGPVNVRMGRPIVDGNQLAAEFWVTSTRESPDPFTTAGNLIARLDPSGRCDRFREYWFDLEGRLDPIEGWGE